MMLIAFYDGAKCRFLRAAIRSTGANVQRLNTPPVRQLDPVSWFDGGMQRLVGWIECSDFDVATDFYLTFIIYSQLNLTADKQSWT
jgi:hypothetical protein